MTRAERIEAAAVAVKDSLGHAEWGSDRDAATILQEIIDEHFPALRAALAASPSETAPVDGCPKCRSTNVHRGWTAAGEHTGLIYDFPHRCDDRAEHFHRYCRGCGFRWTEPSPLAAAPPRPPSEPATRCDKCGRPCTDPDHHWGMCPAPASQRKPLDVRCTFEPAVKGTEGGLCLHCGLPESGSVHAAPSPDPGERPGWHTRECLDDAAEATSRGQAAPFCTGCAPSPAAAPPPGDGEGPSERYDRMAEEFHRATGMMAPGKDAPPYGGGGSLEERQAAWEKWLSTRALAAPPSPSPAPSPAPSPQQDGGGPPGSVRYGCKCGWWSWIRPDLFGPWECPKCERMNERTPPAPVEAQSGDALSRDGCDERGTIVSALAYILRTTYEIEEMSDEQRDIWRTLVARARREYDQLLAPAPSTERR